MSWVLVSAIVGCSGGDPYIVGTTTPAPTGTPPPVTAPPYGGGFLEGEFCDVQAVFQVACVTGCHSADIPGGGLDLDTDPFYAIVGVPGSGGTLVVPGDPSASFLYTRMKGEGVVPMPPTGVLDEPFRQVISNWIANGAVNDCQEVFVEPPGSTTDYTEEEPYHPPGWEDGGVHGVANNLQQDQDCRLCHGAQLDGGTSGQSCDECHDPGWRTDCTFCHGGVDNLTGAPPKDIDGSPISLAFPAHTEHVAGYDHPAYGCSECHEPRYDVLTPGHIFDDVTAGYGEVYYGNGLSQYATYLFGTCTNTYCHGSGLADDGTSTVGETMYCYSCHPDAITSGVAEWAQMSGRHLLHMEDADAQCYECHSTVTDANQQIIGPQYHVDGYKTVVPLGVAWDGLTCNGSCHNHDHDADTW